MPELILTGTDVQKGVRMTGGVPSDFVIKDVSNEMMLVEPVYYPLMQWAFLSKSVKRHVTANVNSLYEFSNRELLPNIDTIVDNGTGGSATIVIEVAEPDLWVTGKSVRFEDTDETGIVTNVSGADVTITKDSGNWTQPTIGTNIYLLGEAHGENDDPPVSVYVDPVMRKTRTQIFQKTVTMTDKMWAATTHGGTYGGNWWDHQLNDRAKEMKRDIEMAFWLNGAHMIRTTSNASVTKTEGAIYQIENYGGFLGGYTGGTASEQELDDFLGLSVRGSKRKTMFVGTELLDDIEQILKGRIDYDGPVARYGPIEGDDIINVLTYRKANVIIDIIWEPLWEGKFAKYGVVLDDNYTTLVSYASDSKGSRRMRLEMDIDENGAPRNKAQMLADIGIALDCAPHHGVFKPVVV